MFRERYSPVAPLESSLLAADQVGEFIDTLPRKRVISSGGPEDRTTG
jgi:hypothetical protein